MITLFIQNGRFFSKRTILSDNSCHFLKLFSSRDLSQDEKRNTFVATERMCGKSNQRVQVHSKSPKCNNRKKNSQLEINHVIQHSTEAD